MVTEDIKTQPSPNTGSHSRPWYPWKIYYSAGVAGHGEKVRKMLGLQHYIPALHLQHPVWFFGMYFDCDYFQILAHSGKKIINWRGSDALQLQNSPQRIHIVHHVQALHVCQSIRQQAILDKLNIQSIVRPMFNTPLEAVTMSSFPVDRTEILVLWRRGIDDFIRADMFFEIASRCPDVVFHIVGDEDADRFNQPGMENLIFHGFVDETTLDRIMGQCKGTIRPWVCDGTPNIQTKMLLKGRYAAHSCRFEKVAHCTTVEQYVDWINHLKQVKEPNIEARQWWIQHLNNFDFLEMGFTPDDQSYSHFN